MDSNLNRSVGVPHSLARNRSEKHNPASAKSLQAKVQKAVDGNQGEGHHEGHCFARSIGSISINCI